LIMRAIFQLDILPGAKLDAQSCLVAIRGDL
jgi:hypothetical protein